MEAILDELGRIQIPREVRDDLGLSTGAILEIQGLSGGILLKPLPTNPPLSHEGGVLVYGGDLLEDPEQTIREDREARARKLAGLE
jgi:AbrB family looped-hinge helix DNA binding protein